MKTTNRTKALLVGVLLLAVAQAAMADVDVGSFQNQYKTAASSAWDVIAPYAEKLFWILAAIHLAWAGATMALEKSELQGWITGLIRHVMFIGFGWALLLNAKTWMWAIFNSFSELGKAVVTTPVEPGDIFGRGVDLAMRISSKPIGLDIPLGLAYFLCALVIVVAFTMLAVSLVLALVEGAIAVVIGQVLLGFGGSKWTVGYTEKYLGMIVNVGLKVFTTYFMVHIAFVISDGWLAIADASDNVDKVYELVGGSLILMMVTWTLPRFVSMVIGGSPSLGFADAMGATAGLAAGVGGALGGAMGGAYKGGGKLGEALTPKNSLAALGGAAAGGGGTAVPPPTNSGGGGSGGTTPPSSPTSPITPAGSSNVPAAASKAADTGTAGQTTASAGSAGDEASAGVAAAAAGAAGTGASGSEGGANRGGARGAAKPPTTARGSSAGGMRSDPVTMAAMAVAARGGVGMALATSRVSDAFSGSSSVSPPSSAASAFAAPGAGSDGGIGRAGAGITNAAPMTSTSGDSAGVTLTPGAKPPSSTNT